MSDIPVSSPSDLTFPFHPSYPAPMSFASQLNDSDSNSPDTQSPNQNGHTSASATNSNQAQKARQGSPSDARVESQPAGEGAGSKQQKPKQKRNRQQLSCVECHRRKQSCNREIPCQRCKARGMENQCRVATSADRDAESPDRSSYTPKASASSGQDGDASDPSKATKRRRTANGGTEVVAGTDSKEIRRLLNRVSQLENLVRISLPTKAEELINSASGGESDDAAVETAVAALGQLSRSNGGPGEGLSSIRNLSRAVEPVMDGKAIGKAGGDKTWTYIGPGTVAEFLHTSSSNDSGDPSDNRMPQNLWDMTQGGLLPSTLPQDQRSPTSQRAPDSVDDFVSQWPARDLCDFLVDIFYSIPEIQGSFTIGFRPVFQTAYRRLWKGVDKQKRTQTLGGLPSYLGEGSHDMQIDASLIQEGQQKEGGSGLDDFENPIANFFAPPLQSDGYRPKSTLAFFSLSTMVICLAIQLLPETAYSYVDSFLNKSSTANGGQGEGGGQTSYPTLPPAPNFATSRKELQLSLFLLAKTALLRAELIGEKPNYARIEAVYMTGIYQKNEGRPNDNYHKAGEAVRMAQEMGMHREGEKAWGLGAFEAEMRRRMWWHLYSYDRFMNFTFGRPYMIHQHHCDVRMPKNIDWADLTEDGPTNIKPADHPTDYSFRLLMIQLGTLAGKISDACFSGKTPSYSKILELDSEVQAFEANFPARFRCPTAEELGMRPYLSAHFQYMSLYVAHLRSMLHRPYLLRKLPKSGNEDPYARSKITAISLSKKIISLERDMQAELPASRKKAFMYPFNTFDAAANLAIAVLQDASNVVEGRKLDEWVLEARALLVKMGPDNIIAVEGIQSIDWLRSRYAKNMGVEVFPDTFGRGPNSSVRVPYLGGEIMSSSASTTSHATTVMADNAPSLSPNSSLLTGSAPTPAPTPPTSMMPPTPGPHQPLDPEEMTLSDLLSINILPASVGAYGWPCAMDLFSTKAAESPGAGWDSFLSNLPA